MERETDKQKIEKREKDACEYSETREIERLTYQEEVLDFMVESHLELPALHAAHEPRNFRHLYATRWVSVLCTPVQIDSSVRDLHTHTHNTQTHTHIHIHIRTHLQKELVDKTQVVLVRVGFQSDELKCSVWSKWVHKRV